MCVVSDRPYRLTGHSPTGEFIAQCGDGNVVLREPVISNGDLSYAVEVTDSVGR